MLQADLEVTTQDEDKQKGRLQLWFLDLSTL